MYKEIPIKDVKIPRGRRALMDIEVLSESIRQHGLLNPISVTENLRLVAGETVVDLKQFIIDTTAAPVLTGLAKVNGSVVGRIPLFKVSLPALDLPLPSARKLVISGAGLTLTPEGAAALNSIFGVTAFVEDFPIGTARVTVQKGGGALGVNKRGKK